MRLSFKLLLISEAVLLVAVLVLVYPVRVAMHRQVIRQVQQELESIAINSAPLLDGDLHRLVEAGGDGADEAFATLRAALVGIRDRNVPPLTDDHIYTFYRDGDQVRFAVMGQAETFVGDPYTLRPGMLEVFTKGVAHATEPYEDEHGMWISAYAPIRDSNGAVVGLLEVDRSPDTYLESLERVTVVTLLLAAAALVISSLLGWHVLNALVIWPMREIRAGVTALGRQEFAHRVELKTGDEFQELGNTLNDISKQLNAAKVIQASFFPKQMPQEPGYRVAGLSIPCDAAGGDYFDAFAIGDGRLAVLLADVSGHGLGPALLMATCRSALRALAVADLSPRDLVDRLNALLLEDLVDGRFITLVYGVLEPDGTLTYTNAGHGPAIVAHDGTLEHLASHRPPLGIELPPDDDGQSTIRLAPGDRILFASDGLSEARDGDGTYFGVAPIEEAITDRSVDCDAIVARLREALQTHCNGPSTTDDVTILCVDRV